MNLKNIVYYDAKKKKVISVKICESLWSKFSGLMFRKNSPPLLFVFKKEMNIEIHSFFCKPFYAIWIDKNNKVKKKIKVTKWLPLLSGTGKYLLEIPLKNGKN